MYCNFSLCPSELISTVYIIHLVRIYVYTWLPILIYTLHKNCLISEGIYLSFSILKDFDLKARVIQRWRDRQRWGVGDTDTLLHPLDHSPKSSNLLGLARQKSVDRNFIWVFHLGFHCGLQELKCLNHNLLFTGHISKELDHNRSTVIQHTRVTKKHLDPLCYNIAPAPAI